VKRRLINLLTAVSLCISLLAISFWIHSYFRVDTLTFLGRSLVDVSNRRGNLVLSRRTCQGGWKYPGKFEFNAFWPAETFEFPGGTTTQFLGAGYCKEIDGWISIDVIAIPYWMIATAAAVLPILASAGRIKGKYAVSPGPGFETVPNKILNSN
jgi:hypothetical protein